MGINNQINRLYNSIFTEGKTADSTLGARQTFGRLLIDIRKTLCYYERIKCRLEETCYAGKNE